MEKLDVVYVLANGIKSDEIRYSVRSVVKNFPYNRIVFYGGKPKGIEPDIYVEVNQVGYDRYEKVSYTLNKIFADDNLTENFWLFNDDFFIMKPVDEFPYAFGGTIEYRVNDLDFHHGPSGGYIRAQKGIKDYLVKHGYDTLNYALHIPMLINRELGAKTLEEHPNQKMFRSLYGNVNKVGGIRMDDVKIYNSGDEPDKDSPLLSTKDSSFRYGLVGDYIRETFNEPCKYEEEIG